MEAKEVNAEFTIHTDNWNTLGLIQKVFIESERTKVPLKIEIKSGSFESIVHLIADLATIATFMSSLVIYFANKRKNGKPLEFVKISHDAAYAVAWGHLTKTVKVKNFKLIKAFPDTAGDYHFEFGDSAGYRHSYIIFKNFQIKYSRR